MTPIEQSSPTNAPLMLRDEAYLVLERLIVTGSLPLGHGFRKPT